MPASPVYTVTDYLLDRLASAGVDRLFGVPGDFTLALLDHVEAHPVVEWVGCANELGAGYAADGYARVRGLGALCTTFGVGELSAINAIAGGYAEHVPVLHIVGAPTLATQAAGRATHHTLGDGDFRHFARMTAEVTCVQESLTADNAVEAIDRVIAEVLERRLPGYLIIPADVGQAPAFPPRAALPRHPGVSDPEALALFEAAARELLGDAQRPVLIADILVQRMGAQPQLDALLATNIPHATLLWGRRVVDESAPSYLGTYVGAISAPRVTAAVDDADAVVLAGVQFTDLTSGFFSQHLEAKRLIDVGPRSSTIAGQLFAPLAMTDALAALVTLLPELPVPAAAANSEESAVIHDADEALSQASLWSTIGGWLRPGDLILADQGTSFYGMGGQPLPHDVLFIGQPLWASIGYTLPGLLGAALAEPSRRPVVLIGDGAAQLTIAELGTLLRQRVPATVIVVDNSGYTVERAIHGAEARYNDIASWDWAALPGVLGDEQSQGYRVETPAALAAALGAAASRPDVLTLIQAVVPALDVPPLLSALAAQASAANRSVDAPN